MRNMISCMIRFVTFALVIFALTGMSRIPPGSESYQDGWLQGCFEGYSAGGWRGYDYYIDPIRLANEDDYRQGREDGLQRCYKEAIARPKGIGAGK